VSSERQQEEHTIESQLTDLRRACAQLQIVDEYLDDGYTGEILARPGLDRLRDDARTSRFAAVYIHSPDRLARKYAYQVLVVEELRKRGVQVVFLNRALSDTPEDNLLLGVQGLIAEYEKTKILERTRRGKLQKARGGTVVGGIPPYGYTYVRTEGERYGRYVIHETEAATVRLIFELYECTGSVRQVARDLTERQIRPRQGIRWGGSSLHRILRNETYCGTTYYNKHRSVEVPGSSQKYRRRLNAGRQLRPRDEWVPITVPALMDRAQFARAQERLRQNHHPPVQRDVTYLLAGLVRCASCGAAFTREICKGYRYYRCNNRHRRFPLPRTCDARMIAKERLDAAVWQRIVDAIQRPDLLAEHVRRLHGGLHNTADATRQRIAALTNRLDQLKVQQQRLLDLYTQADLDRDALQAKSRDLAGRRAALQDELHGEEQALAGVIRHAAQPEAVARFCEVARHRLQNLDEAGKAEFVRRLVREVRLDSRRGLAQIVAAIPLTGDTANPEDDNTTGALTPLAGPEANSAISSTDSGTAYMSLRYCGRNPRKRPLPLCPHRVGKGATIEFSFQVELSEGGVRHTYYR
jgi:site-specific DNA recombinase